MICPFCNIDYSDIANTIIEETYNFIISPTKGSLCDGYLLIIPKHHVNSINELNENIKYELSKIICKYRDLFFKKHNKHPIFFEHGSSNIDNYKSASSITHAHIHIVNHNFKNEHNIINELNLNKVTQTEFFANKNQNYISYISPNFNFYISYNFRPTSQQMRIYIAKDLNLLDKFNWKTNNFDNNIISTINNFKKQK